MTPALAIFSLGAGELALMPVAALVSLVVPVLVVVLVVRKNVPRPPT